MNKREYCMTHESVAYYSGLNGLEIKGIEYGIAPRFGAVPVAVKSYGDRAWHTPDRWGV